MTAPRLRVLLTTDAVGGIWTYTADLAAGLVARDVDVTLAVLGPRPTPTMTAALPGSVDLIETDLPLDWIDGLESAPVSATGVSGLAAACNASLIHLNSPALAGLARFPVPIIGGCHSCLATWWQSVRRDEDLPEAFATATAMLGRGYAACDALIAPSRAFAAATEQVYGVSPEVVLNGRSGSPRGDPPRQAIALTAGRLWDPAKGVAILDRAASLGPGRVEAAGPTEGPDGSRITLENVTCLGRLEDADLRRRMETSAVFVSLSMYEPFGLSVLEAAQSGCALLLSDIPTFRELWDGAAVFTSPTDPVAAARALEGLLSNADRCAELGAAAATRAERYAADAMAEATLALYGRTLARRPIARAA